MTMLKSHKLTVDTTGAAGLATGSADTGEVIRGRIIRIDVDYNAAAPATTDLTITEKSALLPKTLVSLPNTNADTTIYPAFQLTDETGTGVAEYESVAVNDYLTVALDQCDALTPAITVEIFYEDYVL
jgi:hypothetical protein